MDIDPPPPAPPSSAPKKVFNSSSLVLSAALVLSPAPIPNRFQADLRQSSNLRYRSSRTSTSTSTAIFYLSRSGSKISKSKERSPCFLDDDAEVDQEITLPWICAVMAGTMRTKSTPPPFPITEFCSFVSCFFCFVSCSCLKTRHELKFVSCSCLARVVFTRIEIRVVFVFAKFVSCKFVSDTNTRHDDTNCQVYLNDMFKMNAIISKDMNKSNTSSTYMLECSNVWHDRLGHVSYNSICRFVKLDYIPNFDIDSNHKCPTCVEAKLTRSFFQMVERDTESLDLIHIIYLCMADDCSTLVDTLKQSLQFGLAFMENEAKSVAKSNSNQRKQSRYLFEMENLNCYRRSLLSAIDLWRWRRKEIKRCRRRRYLHRLPESCKWRWKALTERCRRVSRWREGVNNEEKDKFVFGESTQQINKVVKSDRGGYYVSPYADFCVQNGIHHLHPIHLNKMVLPRERINRWRETILSTNYPLNKIPLKENDETLY
ncbi:hypothetical protein LXL04_024427 [Taraxacum kok-saghyz]